MAAGMMLAPGCPMARRLPSSISSALAQAPLTHVAPVTLNDVCDPITVELPGANCWSANDALIFAIGVWVPAMATPMQSRTHRTACPRTAAGKAGSRSRTKEARLLVADILVSMRALREA